MDHARSLPLGHHLTVRPLVPCIATFAILRAITAVIHSRSVSPRPVSQSGDEIGFTSITCSGPRVWKVKAGAFDAAVLVLYAFGQPVWHAIARELVTRRR